MTLNRFDAPNIGIAVYNEDKNLEKTLRSLRNGIIQLNFFNKPNLYICFNGCNDNSISIFMNLLRDLRTAFKIHILSSKKGKLRAHKVIIENIKNSKPVLFLDADIIIPAETISVLLNALYADEKLIVCSAYPYVMKPKNLDIYSRLIFPIINFKRIYPEIEISRENVSEFHPGAKSDFEKKSRVYFHGRCFILRNKKFYEFPKDQSKIIGDDTFLSFNTILKYPRGSIKVLYEARVYSQPQLSFKTYLRTWLRIRKDLETIYKENPEFLKLKKYVSMKINWGFVLQDLRVIGKIQAILFYLLRSFEKAYYSIRSKEINLDEIWAYRSGEK